MSESGKQSRLEEEGKRIDSEMVEHGHTRARQHEHSGTQDEDESSGSAERHKDED